MNNVLVSKMTESANVAANLTQRVKLQIRSNGQLTGIVDDKVVLNTTINLSDLPDKLTPGIGANSYPSQRFTFDNLVVRKLAL